ncbi:MarR family winged helix-turn-helix transcriptional regulator [Spongisporangium articulatum]|uniref:MarR family winged helix-turn-helix transcriptional regulator n=1 Tax=Spongisporangium articulatum TaxID=3362603 RepID=A0ABW8AJ23_9ACTN
MNELTAADLRVALLRLARRVRAEKADSELTDTQFSLLAALDRRGRATLKALAEFERVQPPSMTKTVAHLVDRGLVTRSRDPDDGRQAFVELTAAGHAAVDETRRRRDAWLGMRLAALDDRERAVLADATEIMRRIATE